MGDFRIDYNPPEKVMTHENVKKVLDGKTVHLMMSDSTNSFQLGRDSSESDTFPFHANILNITMVQSLLPHFQAICGDFKMLLKLQNNQAVKLHYLDRSVLRNA